MTNYIKKYDTVFKWIECNYVTSSDMKTFLGLIIFMGQIKSHWKDYQSTDPSLETHIFPKIIMRKTFKQIMTFLHFNNNLGTPLPADRISKVKPLLNYFLPKFWLIHLPKQEQSFDEAMIKWKGQFRFKTYNPGKLRKYGNGIHMQPWDLQRWRKETAGNNIISPTTLSWFMEPYLSRQLLQ